MKNSTLIGRFNHRIIQENRDGIEMYKLVTVYYDLDGTPTDYTEDGGCGCISSLYDATIEKLEAFNRPVLNEWEIDYSRSVLEKEDEMVGPCHQEKQPDWA